MNCSKRADSGEAIEAWETLEVKALPRITARRLFPLPSSSPSRGTSTARGSRSTRSGSISRSRRRPCSPTMACSTPRPNGDAVPGRVATCRAVPDRSPAHVQLRLEAVARLQAGDSAGASVKAGPGWPIPEKRPLGPGLALTASREHLRDVDDLFGTVIEVMAGAAISGSPSRSRSNRG